MGLNELKGWVLKGFALAMGVASLVLLILKEVSQDTVLVLLSLGLIALSIDALEKAKEKIP